MSKKSFEQFGRLAKKSLSFTEIAGRYAFQEGNERYILFNIWQKLRIAPADDLLEIGCGAGNILIPLSFFVHSATGVDHPALLKILRERARNAPIRCIPGNFLDRKISGHFSKILVYSVLHYLSDEKEVLFFLDKAVKCLTPGGTLFLGDIPNVDLKKRFLASPRGRAFNTKWQKIKKIEIVEEDKKLVTIGDLLLNKIVNKYNRKGFRAKTMRQPSSLPFCHTREDILIARI